MYLGQVLPSEKEQSIMRDILQQARVYFPEQTVKAEDFIQRQAINYGISSAKLKMEATKEAVLKSPYTFLVIGGIVAYIFTRR